MAYDRELYERFFDAFAHEGEPTGPLVSHVHQLLLCKWISGLMCKCQVPQHSTLNLRATKALKTYMP